MEEFATGLADAGIAVARFEFPYMAKRREGLGGGAPDPAAVLLETWAHVIAAIDRAGTSRRALAIGGKSMGGRIASMVADGQGVLALACLGYPFHPPGRAATPKRLDHLATLATPTLIVQGERDEFGSKEEVAGYALSDAIRVHWMGDGDHSFKPRKASGRTAKQNLAESIAVTAAFIHEVWETQRSL